MTRDKLPRDGSAGNSAFDHGGNIAIALLAGGVGYAFPNAPSFSWSLFLPS